MAAHQERRYRAGPLGTKCGSVSLGGAMWDIYEGDIGWKVHSFVRRTNTTKSMLDLDDFPQALVRRNLLRQRQVRLRHRGRHRGLQGHGRLDTKAYSVNIG